MMVKKRKLDLHDGTIGAAITVRVTPRTARDEIHDILDDGTIKIRLTAPPVEGKANKELVKFLSSILDVPPSAIEILAGQSGHDKLLSIMGLSSQEVQKKILNHLEK